MEAWEVLLAGKALIGGVAAWFVRSEMTRERKGRVKTLLREVDGAYAHLSRDARRCEEELLRLRELALKEFKDGKISEGDYAILERRIDAHLKALRKPG